MAGAEAGPTVSVIIPVHRGGDVFARCLDSVAVFQPAPDEVLVVVDGADAAAVRQVDERGFAAVRLPVRRGPAAARNAGARAARGEVLFFLDADVAPPPNAVARVRRSFSDVAGLAALFGSYDDEPAASNFLSQYKNLQHHFVHQHANERAATFWGACGAIRAAVFHDAGGFDESYTHPSIEDIELGARLHAGGHHIRLDKELRVKHLKCWRTGTLLRAEVLRRAIPWTRLILRQGRMPNDLNLRWSGRWSVVAAFAGVAALLAAWRWPALLSVTALAAAALLAMNFPLYRFFHRRRGLLFALAAVPWHWFYFLYGGAGFAAGLVVHLVSGGRHRPAEAAGAAPIRQERKEP
jgi:GT2 family glycosyltransferase